VTTYGYDQHGNQSTITDAGGHAWTSTFNLLGQVTAKTDPDTHATTALAYDGDGNLLQQANADAGSNTVSFTYDQLNRKTGQYAAPSAGQVPYASTSSPGNQMASWVYDNANHAVTNMPRPVGHLTTETAYSNIGNGTTTVAYIIQQAGFNIFSEPTGERYTIPATTSGTGLSGSYVFTHGWTIGKGLPFGQSYPSAGGLPSESVSLSYLSNPLDLPAGLGGTITGYAQNTSYDQWGDILKETIGSGTNVAAINNTYDTHTLRLTDQLVNRAVTTPASVDEEKYNYDPYGNVTSQASARLGSATVTETQCYQYDGLDQLTQAWTASDNCAATPTTAAHSMVTSGINPASAYWTSWAYDITAGDARSEVLGEMRQQLQHSLTSAQDITTANAYGGANGGPHALTLAATTGGSTSSSSFGYDPAGNITTRTTPAGGTQALSWNAAGQLTQASGGTGGTTTYLYAPDGSLLLQENPGSSTLYLDGEQLTATTSGGTTTVTGARIIPLPSGGDVVRTGSGTTYSFEVPDPHGTNDLYLDSTAQAPTWRQFTPYGAPRGPAATWIDNRGFLNKPADPATGLTYVGARAYDPATSQFISPDPVLDPADPQGLNAYLYGTGNPVDNSDPTGLYVPVDPTSPVDPVDQFKDANPVHHGTPGGSDHGTANTSHDGGKTHGPGSPGGDCPWLPGLSAALCAHSNPIHTPQYLSLFTAVKKPAQDTGLCATAMQMFLGLITTCGPSLAASSGDDETGDTSATASGGGDIPGNPLGPLAKALEDAARGAAREFSKVYPGGSTVLSEVNADGVMTMAIEAEKGSATGGQMFTDAMTNMGPENVKAFQTKWVRAMPSNLNAFNANLRAGMSYEEAASNTFTGHMLARYGITEVSIGPGGLVGDFGNYTNVEVVFSRPGG
jgi:RHS repeat-associated protein